MAISSRSPEMPAFLNSTRSEIQAKFIDLEWGQRHRLALGVQRTAPGAPPSQWARANTKSMAERVRYSNIDPFESNRVRLKVPPGTDDYINASPIVLKSKATGVSNNQERKWIATQGPKSTSQAHLYRLIQHETGSENDTAVIIMLTQTHEAGREKCFQYYPMDSSRPVIRVRDRGEFNDGWRARIVLESKTDEDFCRSEVRTMRMEVLAPREVSASDNASGNTPAAETPADEEGDNDEYEDMDEEDYDTEETLDEDDSAVPVIFKKTIKQYLFSAWPDFGVPEGDDRDALLELIQESRRISSKGVPPIVHCSAGVGRTGTFIALDFLLEELDAGVFDSGKYAGKGTDDDPIAETVDVLRQQRMMMVQGEMQFVFLYEVLKQIWLQKHKV